MATRHHCIDWNYVGEPRPRPNKWRVEMGPGGDVWKEWGFAKVGVFVRIAGLFEGGVVVIVVYIGFCGRGVEMLLAKGPSLL